MPILLLDRSFQENDLNESDELDIRNIGPKAWPTILSKCRATTLRLYHITLPSLEGINSLSNTRQLTLEWATKVTDLEPVFGLTKLTTLSIFDFQNIRKINGIEALCELTELNLSGSRGCLSPPLRLESIQPVSRIAGLTKFSLINAKINDDNIKPLEHCSNLRHLRLSNNFDRVQFAY